MTPARPPRLWLIQGRPFGRTVVAAVALVTLAACEQNTYAPPPPPKVDVALPVQRSVTRYLEVTGNTAPIKSVDLVARVQGFLLARRRKASTFLGLLRGWAR